MSNKLPPHWDESEPEAQEDLRAEPVSSQFSQNRKNIARQHSEAVEQASTPPRQTSQQKQDIPVREQASPKSLAPTEKVKDLLGIISQGAKTQGNFRFPLEIKVRNQSVLRLSSPQKLELNTLDDLTASKLINHLLTPVTHKHSTHYQTTPHASIALGGKEVVRIEQEGVVRNHLKTHALRENQQKYGESLKRFIPELLFQEDLNTSKSTLHHPWSQSLIHRSSEGIRTGLVSDQSRIVRVAGALLKTHGVNQGEHFQYSSAGYLLKGEGKKITIMTHNHEVLLESFRGITGHHVLVNRLSKEQEMDFLRAGRSIAHYGMNKLSSNPERRTLQLGQLAPDGDRKFKQQRDAYRLKEIARIWLDTEGVASSKEGKRLSEGDLYRFEESANSFKLTAKRAANREEVVVNFERGAITESHITFHDLEYFSALSKDLSKRFRSQELTIATQPEKSSVPTQTPSLKNLPTKQGKVIQKVQQQAQR